MSKLSHFDEDGKAAMVDVSSKDITERSATAEGSITMAPETLALIAAGSVEKGDVLDDCLLLQEPKVLEDTSHALPEFRYPPRRQAVDMEVRDVDIAGRGRLFLEQQTHERRLAGTGRTDEKDERPLVHRERHIVQSGPGRRLVRLGAIRGAIHGSPV